MTILNQMLNLGKKIQNLDKLSYWQHNLRSLTFALFSGPL